MILYISIINILLIILFLVNVLLDLTAFSSLVTFLFIIGITAYQFAADGLFAFIVHLMPNKWFEIDNKFYSVSSKERKFYEKIKIRKWKDKVWELGSLGGFSKKNLKSSSDINYIKRFIIESNKGVLTHIIGCFVGFTALIFFPFECILSLTLPICIINFIMNLPSLFILRYNTPKLHAGYKRLCRNEQKNNTSDLSANYDMAKNDVLN